MSEATTFEAPGFRGRVTGKLGKMLIVDAELDGEIDSHVATSDEFAIVLSGRIRVTIGGETSVHSPGDYLLVPAGTEHAISAETPSRLILIGEA